MSPCPSCQQIGKKISTIYREEYVKTYTHSDIKMSGILLSSHGSATSRGYQASVRALNFKPPKKPVFSFYSQRLRMLSQLFVFFIFFAASALFLNAIFQPDDTATSNHPWNFVMDTTLTQHMGSLFLTVFGMLSLAILYCAIKGKAEEEIQEENALLEQYETKKTEYDLTWYCQMCDATYLEKP